MKRRDRLYAGDRVRMGILDRANRAFFRYAVYGPATTLLGQPFLPALRKLDRTQYWSAEKLRSYQEEKLDAALRHAVLTVPYYRVSLGPLIRGEWSLPDLPLIEKELIRDRQESFCSEEKFRISRKTTGGSTGQPVTILKSSEAMGWEQAGTWRGYRWAGLDVGDSQLRFWGVPLDGQNQMSSNVRDFLLHRRRCSAFAFNEEDLEEYYQLLCRFRPAYLYGYVSMLDEFARFIASDPNKKVDFLTCIITTAEVLTPAHRQVIEQGLGCKVYNEYGCGEFGSIAHECEFGALHITSENVLVEALKDGDTCEMGEVGELVVTELNNRAMPLIRYRVGDFGSVSDSSCACGRSLPVLDNLYGRAYDTIVNSDGKRFHGEFFLYLLQDCRNSGLDIQGIQIIQRSIEKIDVKIVSNTDYSAICDYMSKRLIEKFDAKATITFIRTDQISRESSGKMRLIVGHKEILDGS